MNPFRSFRSADEELSPEELEKELAAEKANRIKFHGEQVRTGPRKLSYVGNGQLRRQVTRDRKTAARKATRTHWRNHFLAKRHLFALRGRLQAVGAVPYVDGRKVDRVPQAIHRSLVEEFGSIEQASEHYQTLEAARR